MKIKITRPDGTVIEAEGTADECERIAGGAPPLRVADQPVYIPVTLPTVPHPYDWPWYPGAPTYVGPTVDRIEITCGSVTRLSADAQVSYTGRVQ